MPRKNNKLSKWKLYVLKCVDGTLYTGITTDVTRRLHEHNSTKKGAKYTRSRRPVKLVYTKSFDNRSLVCKAEARFKKLNRPAKMTIIQSGSLWKN